MKIPVDIHVRAEHLNADHIRRGEEHPETEDYRVSGIMKKTKEGYRIEYREEGDVFFTTIDTFADDTVSLNRVGPINTHMVFADGKTHTCICNTGFYPLHMRIRTKSLDNSLSMEGGRLHIDYSVEIVGNLAERSKLYISVSPDISIIRS